jgi:hypothetical protein
MTGRKTPRHHTGHTEPIRTPALRHSIDGNHPELREGQEDSALSADLHRCGYSGANLQRQGRLRVRVGRAVRDLGPGESVVVPPGIVHAFSNPAGEPVRVITREMPAGQLEAQLRVMSSAGRLPPLLRLAEVNARNGFSFFVAGVPEFPQRLLWRGLAGLARLRNFRRSSSN